MTLTEIVSNYAARLANKPFILKTNYEPIEGLRNASDDYLMGAGQ